MREAPRELGEGFAVYSAELKRAAIRLHVYGHYRPVPVRDERPLTGNSLVKAVVYPSEMPESAAKGKHSGQMPFLCVVLWAPKAGLRISKPSCGF